MWYSWIYEFICHFKLIKANHLNIKEINVRICDENSARYKTYRWNYRWNTTLQHWPVEICIYFGLFVIYVSRDGFWVLGSARVGRVKAGIHIFKWEHHPGGMPIFLPLIETKDDDDDDDDQHRSHAT
jgi:hypothetical protein